MCLFFLMALAILGNRIYDVAKKHFYVYFWYIVHFFLLKSISNVCNNDNWIFPIRLKSIIDLWIAYIVIVVVIGN